MIVAENRTDIIRKNLAVRILKELFAGTLQSNIDSLPVVLYPKDKTNIRCCVHKDRAVTRYRMLALLGIDVDSDDDLRPLHRYLEQALQRSKPSVIPLTVITDACSACSSGTHAVTDMCQGCVAQYCRTNCPRDAISFINGKAVIDPGKCVNCGKCKNVCPYNAISYVPIPCEQNCPVGAIKKDENGRAIIDAEKCISCGKCMRSCPFGAVEMKSELIDVAAALIDTTVHVSALVAPSAAGQFPGTPAQLIFALRDAGFDAVYEVSAGADKTAVEEARELHEAVEANTVLGTSCCPAYVEAVQKHIPEFKPFVSKTRTPASFSGEEALQEKPETRTVFIGPCVAKKTEAHKDPFIDYVLTFDETASLLLSKNIDVLECPESMPNNAENSSFARNFPVAGAVGEAVCHYYPGDSTKLTIKSVNGLDRKGIAQLKQIAAGRIECNLVEVMCCEGGCICGPGSTVNPRISHKKHQEYAENGVHNIRQPAAYL